MAQDEWKNLGLTFAEDQDAVPVEQNSQQKPV